MLKAMTSSSNGTFSPYEVQGGGLLTLGIQSSECITWAEALQPEHVIFHILWIVENTLNLQLIEKSVGLLLAIIESQPEVLHVLLPPLMKLGLPRLLVNLLTFEMSERIPERQCMIKTIIVVPKTLSFTLMDRKASNNEVKKRGRKLEKILAFEITHTRSNGQAANETTQEALMKFKRLTTEVAKGSLQMSGDEMFVEVVGPKHHGRVRGYGDGISPTELWGSSSSTIRDLQMQLKESEERCKENDANLLRQLKEYEERSKENDANLLRKLKKFKEHCKESDANVQLLKAQVNWVESLLAQVLKNMAPFELAQFDSSS
ncbi:hypothetical protein SO802_013569 [Lithocarpus litseifolius]|uniref:Uncharacterized protein n=1 Tax=Lithocarpus litseifolius TaxID=425828 RepID=A0AAW2D8M1_9ROSI